jgi:hypothetical protein
VGGLSILVFVPLLLSGMEELGFVTLGALAWAQMLVNMSHFMASYRIVYRDKEMILRHKWASIGVPLILLLYMAVALAQAQSGPPVLVGVMVAVASGYLAWHYTGQVWGMMASHAYLAGLRFDDSERQLVRISLRILLVWHLIWFVRIWFQHTALGTPPWVEPVYRAVTVAAVAALGIGGAGLVRFRRRTGRPPPAAAVVAWLALFVWYAVMARWGLWGLFLVQLAHAIQYLEFPARVELNRAARTSAGRAARHMALYVGGLLGASFLITWVVPGPAMGGVADFFGIQAESAAPVLLLMFINIHHYFTDGVAWKLRNPRVQEDLFAHVQEATIATPSRHHQATGSTKDRSDKR